MIDLSQDIVFAVFSIIGEKLQNALHLRHHNTLKRSQSSRHFRKKIRVLPIVITGIFSDEKGLAIKYHFKIRLLEA
jgi:hypothetical protein